MTIRCADSRTEQLAGSFAAWLSRRWPAHHPVNLYVVPDEYLSIGADDCCGFGVYLYEDNEARIGVISPAAWANILIANGEPADEAQREFVLTIAHEYAHHLQLEQASGLSDDDADEFAARVVQEYLYASGPALDIAHRKGL